jgi:predicted ATPase with chaperone activity
MISQLLSSLVTRNLGFRGMFDDIIGYDGIKRTIVRSLTSKKPVHILLVGPPGQTKTLFLKCILETFGETKLGDTLLFEICGFRVLFGT